MLELIIIGALAFYAGFSMDEQDKSWFTGKMTPCPQQEQVDKRRP